MTPDPPQVRPVRRLHGAQPGARPVDQGPGARATCARSGPFNPKVVIDGFFDLRYAENPGVAFSMLQDMPGGRVLLTLLAVAAFVLVIVYLRKTPVESSRLHVALGLVGGGAIGNLIDRMLLRQGHRLHRLEGRRARVADVQHRRRGAVRGRRRS